MYNVNTHKSGLYKAKKYQLKQYENQKIPMCIFTIYAHLDLSGLLFFYSNSVLLLQFHSITLILFCYSVLLLYFTHTAFHTSIRYKC